VSLDDDLNKLPVVGNCKRKTIEDIGLNIVLPKCINRSYTGMKTGFNDIDNMFNGFCPNSLYFLVASSNTGKSIFLLNIARNLAYRGKRTLYVDLDNEVEGSVFRLAQMNMRKPIYLPLTQPLNEYDEEVAIKDMERWLTKEDEACVRKNITTIGQAGMCINELVENINQANDDLIIIDYMQSITTKNSKDENQRMSEVADALKYITENKSTPLLVASQTARFQISDFKKGYDANVFHNISTGKGSGNIEIRGTALFNISRPWDAEGKLLDQLNVSINKQRYNAKDKIVKLKFYPACQLLEDY